MINGTTIFFYIFAFLSTYVQVFFLLTFIQKRKRILIRKDFTKMSEYPTVTIIVPCYNEEKTLDKTVQSILNLNYPMDKLEIFLIDDGSKDKTWELMQGYKNIPNIKIFTKKNGGKHTALNLGLEHTTSEFVGCLDADSSAHKEALARIMTYFADPEVMAVAPSIIVDSPKNILQKAQHAEYDMAIFNKKMLAFLSAIHVTPGPLSIFRKKVFDQIGNYRKAHNTEDQEIALRMQVNGLRIEHCPDAYVYTTAPNTVKKLYKQRLRWIYGFIKNAFDYKFLLFKKKYGNVAFFTIPAGIISVFSVLFMFGFIFYNLINALIVFIQKILIVGFGSSFGSANFDWFYFNADSHLFVSIVLYGLIVTSLVLGRSMREEKKGYLFLDIIYFMVIYSIIAPFWILKALLNSFISKESSWTAERESKIN